MRALERITSTGFLDRFSHRTSSRGGADGRGYKARNEGPRRQACSEAAGLDEYVEEPEEAQRSPLWRRHARIRRRSRRTVRNAG
jgi:hypothetical protein